jgi:hypothetical protein
VKTVVAVDIDASKVSHCLHNASIYNCQSKITGVTADFTNIKPSDIPNFVDEPKKAVFLSPNWGGHSYLNFEKYSIDYIFPPMRDILKCLKLSPNIMLYLPRNTNIKEMISTLAKMYQKYTDQKEVYIEIEQIIFKGHVKVLVVYTERLAKISPSDIARYMEQNVFNVSLNKDKNKEYLRKLLKGLLTIKRAGLFIDTFGVSQVGGKGKNIASAILGKKKKDLKENEVLKLK